MLLSFLNDLRAFGKEKGWCPYFLARHMVQFVNVVVYSYQYLLDPKVAGIISKEMQRESVMVFDEAHNIDNVCIEALSVSVRKQPIEGATRNINKMAQEINRFKATDAGRLRAEYNRVIDGLAQRVNLPSKHILISPIDLYPRRLNFNPVVSRSFTMSLTRHCICPMVLSRGSDPGVERNYGRLLLEMVLTLLTGHTYSSLKKEQIRYTLKRGWFNEIVWNVRVILYVIPCGVSPF
ncbi:putative DNA helicase [Helianthus anomalus]